MLKDYDSPDGLCLLEKIVEPHKNQGNKKVRIILIGVSAFFLFVMVVLPLFVVVINALRDGWKVYCENVRDEYTVKAFQLTILSTVSAVVINTLFGIFASFLLSKFYFWGKHIMAALIDIPISISPVVVGLLYVLTYGNLGWLGEFLKSRDIKVVFAVPGVILATIFITLPLVFRELLPVLNARGKEEEEAAALMGANGFTIFCRITFPEIKWSLLYGIILCAARAMGEFGAVSVVSGHLRGKTNTLPLLVEILYNEFHTTAAFAVASILIIMAIIILIIRDVIGRKR